MDVKLYIMTRLLLAQHNAKAKVEKARERAKLALSALRGEVLVPKADPDPVIERLRRGEGDAVLNLVRSGDLTWEAVFGMDDFLLMSVYRPGFDPHSPFQFRNHVELRVVPFLDEVYRRVRDGHEVLRHDDAAARRAGFADVTDRYIATTSLYDLKARPEHPGWGAYTSLPSSRYSVRLPSNLVIEEAASVVEPAAVER
jgi:hypothetical protein